jgi:hypothetical protein
MAHSSIESLESRWAPAHLVAGPLPAEFGVDLSAYASELNESVEVVEKIEPSAGLEWLSSAGFARQVVGSLAHQSFYAQEWLAAGGYSIHATARSLSQDQLEALEARFAARGEIAESATHLRRAGRL